MYPLQNKKSHQTGEDKLNSCHSIEERETPSKSRKTGQEFLSTTICTQKRITQTICAHIDQYGIQVDMLLQKYQQLSDNVYVHICMCKARLLTLTLFPLNWKGQLP